uniref:Uncharacterized protein n=2 Tax=Lygus hesperus TaxID=30085 RepID=A0A0K8SDH1_LYGHE
MAKLIFLTCLFVAVWLTEALAEDKWVWGGNGRSAKLSRPYDRLPNEAGRYPGPTPPFVRPPPPINPTKPGIISSHEDNDPTKFDKCKCTHSFNCKSPGISFGSCDAGKKYCCEKRINHSNGIPIDDGSIPEVLAGPGGPVDHLRPHQGQYNNRDNLYGRLEPRRP